MPFIRPETIRIVTKALQEGAAIAAPSFHGERGHPVGFARRFSEELSSLHGDDGARQFLKQHPECVKVFELDDPAAVDHMAKPSDLERSPPAAKILPRDQSPRYEPQRSSPLAP